MSNLRGPSSQRMGYDTTFHLGQLRGNTIEQFQVSPYLAAQSTKLLTRLSLYQLFLLIEGKLYAESL